MPAADMPQNDSRHTGSRAGTGTGEELTGQAARTPAQRVFWRLLLAVGCSCFFAISAYAVYILAELYLIQ